MSAGPDGARHEGLIAICLALLLGLFVVAVAGVLPKASGIPVSIGAPEGMPSPAARNGQAVLLRPDAGGGGAAVALLSFDLPSTAAVDGARWVLQLERDPLEAVWLQRGAWRSPVLAFFAPDEREGVLPASYQFHLPADWSGRVELELHAVASARRTLHPRVMAEEQATRLEQYGVAASAMIYASLFMICMLALALFSAARDRLFLLLFAFALAALLTLGAGNGHLYQLPGLRGFAFWREQGLMALSLLLSATWLQMLLRYSDAGKGRVLWKRVVDGTSLALVVIAALCLLNLAQVGRVLQQLQVGLLVIALLLGAVLLFDAGRRRILMAWALAVLTFMTLAGVMLSHLSTRGQVVDTVLVRYGYQMGVVMGVAILSVGLIGRIGEYRHQRDRELLARADTERRMQRESARTALAAELQSQLRALPVSEIGSAAFRLLVDHLKPLLPAQRWTVVSQGHHGQDLLLADPHGGQALSAQLARRQLALRRQAAGGIPLQQPVTSETSRSILAIEALVPLQIRSPAWGALLLERAGDDGFTTEELSLAGDFARLALMHIDQAVAAVNLRRSAELDALTGSLNRRTIDQWLERSFEEGAREQQPVSVLFLDLDHFKSINDRYGHACGDSCLRAVATALRGVLQEGGLFGRYGGEEFIAILPGRGGAEARVVAEQLRMAVEHLCPQWNGQTLRMTVSVGVATRLEHETTPEPAVARADRALYAAKAGGRNCVQVAPAVFR